MNERNRKASPSSFQLPNENDTEFLTTQPIVTIMVDSPKDPPNSEFGINVTSNDVQQPPATADDVNNCSDVPKSINNDQTTTFTFNVDEIIDINRPIDVNEQPRDTTNIIYDYAEPDDNQQNNKVPTNIENPSTSGIINVAHIEQTQTTNTENENTSDSNSSPSSPSS